MEGCHFVMTNSLLSIHSDVTYFYKYRQHTDDLIITQQIDNYWVAMLILLVFPAVLFLFFLYTLRKDKSSHSLPSPRGLPIIGHLHLLGALPHRAIHKLSKSYGPVMQLRLGLVPVVVVSTAEMAECFLKTHDAIFASRPTMQVREIMSFGSKGIGSSKYGRYWRNMRKLCNVHLLSVSKIDSFMPMRQKEVTDFVEDLKEAGEGHQVVDISAKVGLVIEKITYNMIFGGGNKEMFQLKPFILEAIRLAGVFNLADFVPFTKSFDLQGLKGRIEGASKAIDDFLEMTICEHEQYPISRGQEFHKGFIDILLSVMTSSTSADEEKLDKIDIKALILDMLIAALDTTVITIEWILTELLRHPRVMKRVQEELATAVGLDRMVEEADLDKLLYLNMVVKETMRLHPVAPLLIPHASTEDVTIQGYRIPKESQIMINAWAIGRDTNAWSDNVEEFHPERFINTDIDLRGHDTQLIPFGSGRRKCPGMEMGLRTVNFVTAQVLHCFNLELPYGMSPEDMDMTEKFELTMPRSSPLLALPIYRLHKQGLH